MNEVILHFDNASFTELNRLREELRFETIDEVCAYLIERGHAVWSEETPQHVPTEFLEPTQEEGNFVVNIGTGGAQMFENTLREAINTGGGGGTGGVTAVT